MISAAVQNELAAFRETVGNMLRDAASLRAAPADEPARDPMPTRRHRAPALSADSVFEDEPPRRRRVEFHDIENSISKFSGDDRRRDVFEFLRSFEDVMDSYNADRFCRLRNLRMCLSGAARFTMEMNPNADYHQLKRILVEEYGATLSYEAIYQVLDRTKWNRKEHSPFAYMLQRQLIAQGSHLTEVELIRKIVAGMQLDPPTASLLLTERSLGGFKEAIHCHKPLLAASRPYISRPVSSAAAANTTAAAAATNRPNADSSRGTAARPAAVAGFDDTTDESVRCYNCNRFGHMKPNCPFELRPADSCFKCLQVGHQRSGCSCHNH